MRYVLDFGSANAGGAPVFTVYKRLDTLANLAQPAITEIGGGQFYFEVDWTTVAATSITFKAELAGLEQSDVISAPNIALQGSTVASAGVSSLIGYSTAGVLVARASVQCGFLNLTAAQIAVYDPLASTDPNVVQMLEHLNTLGTELAAQVKAHLQREFTLTTAGGASSYALPADYAEMVDDTLWNRPGLLPLYGPLTPQAEQYLKARSVASAIRTPFRIQGNRLAFPVVPADGLTVSGLYVSSNWIQTAASGTGPDADHVTAATDYVLFDALLVVYGLKLLWLTDKGLDNTAAGSLFKGRLEHVKGKVGGGQTLSLAGGGCGERFIDGNNLPVSGWGV
jgi:hypothetical protein